MVVSFDGVGWHDRWERWLDLAERVPFRFTGFLSGTYLLSDQTRDRYHPPGYPAGTSAIGWRPAADVPVEIADLNRAAAAGMEIGTHFNGHFCATAGLPAGGDTWTTGDWNAELDQFFALLADVGPNNDLSSPRLQVGRGDILGARTPCLEGDPGQLYPALRQHGVEYDASSSTTGLVWPRRDESGLWLVGMPVYPVHGALPDGRTGVPVTAMDYNYFFTQRGASSVGVTPAESAADGRQVLATYRDMYRAAYRGNRAPIVLGNHFNDWNDDAYTQALATFVEQTCGRPDTECVPFRDLVAWLDVQTPRTQRRPRGAAGGGGCAAIGTLVVVGGQWGRTDLAKAEPARTTRGGRGGAGQSWNRCRLE
ncbi:MAG: hypothetical protein R2731_02540 [Nocardioides sp.]